MLRCQRGQVASEYLGMLLVVAAIVGALFAGGLGTRITDHAQEAICKITGGACGGAAGHEPADVDRAAVDRAAADLRTLLGQAPAPTEVAAFFSDLEPGVADALTKAHPELVGNLDGAPIGLRYAANATAIDREIARLQDAGVDDDDARLRKLRELDDPDRHFLLFDPAGDGRLAEVFGDLEHARHVAVVVPGMNNDLNNFNGGNADRVQDQASQFDPDQVATIQWLGYDTPEGATALGQGAAEPGARDLPRFVDGIRA
jgi:Alpha/beta hydrolase